MTVRRGKIADQTANAAIVQRVYMRLTSDKVVVITGSNRGLGLEFVTQIIDNTEAAVVATSRNPAKFDQLQALAKEAPSRLQLVSLDAGDESSVEVFHAFCMRVQHVVLHHCTSCVQHLPVPIMQLLNATLLPQSS